ncbi:MAG: DUF3570 domain-containing protein [Bacteroidota bacterium]
MRLFLKSYQYWLRTVISLVFFGCSQVGWSQSTTKINEQATDSLDIQKYPVEIDFLVSYYRQNGDHSAVTGGIGTESLDDISTEVIVNIPIDSVSRVGIDGGFSHYSSASTDNIDSRVSSASARDNRARIYLSYERDQPKNKSAFGVSAGVSIESDYLSNSIGLNYRKQSADQNRSISLAASVLLDKWTMIFPEELRATAHREFSTDKRRSYSFSANYSHVINRRLQASFHTDVVYQQGIISTPFHRVYYIDGTVGVERLPTSRFKFPIGFRLNYFYHDKSVMRFFYRFYADTYGIFSHTFNLEVPFKPGPSVTLYPFYRFYTQTAADHFAPFEGHAVEAEYRTSDFDLSAFHSHKIGAGIRFSPLYGIGKKKENSILKTIAFRGAAYLRSDGLWAAVVSSRFSFRF